MTTKAVYIGSQIPLHNKYSTLAFYNLGGTDWEYQHSADTRLVNVHVQRLRAQIELDPENPQVVVTVRGVGYKAGLT